mmetsp:Transcript_48649/g.141804  ORF Transcript_48649/g.141804 Transcript_48649/m.141804 type:complete len:306 (-) Transcript_48649:162-1079(-)
MDKVWQHAPTKPVLISGALGGPFCIYTCTPLRNALTLGSQDRSSGCIGLLRKTFRGGPQAGWTGGVAPAIVACPQFLALGPIYHLLNNTLRGMLEVPEGSHAMAPAFWACFGAGMVETFLTYGSQSRNAQMAYNNSMVSFSSVEEGVRKRLKLNKTYQLWGAGAGPMFIRNVLAVAAVRALAPALRERVQLEGVDPRTKAVLCDMSCSMAVSVVTAPIHQLFNFMVTTPNVASMPRRGRVKLAKEFLQRQYLVAKKPTGPGIAVQYTWRISRIAARDFAMRTAYVSTLFTMYMSIERTLVSLMRP